MAVISLIQTHSKSILLGSHSLLDTRLLCLTAPWTSVLGYSQHLKLSMPKSVYVVFSPHSLFINLNIKKCFLTGGLCGSQEGSTEVVVKLSFR